MRNTFHIHGGSTDLDHYLIIVTFNTLGDETKNDSSTDTDSDSELTDDEMDSDLSDDIYMNNTQDFMNVSNTRITKTYPYSKL